jgi:hypothetical protein
MLLVTMLTAAPEEWKTACVPLTPGVTVMVFWVVLIPVTVISSLLIRIVSPTARAEALATFKRVAVAVAGALRVVAVCTRSPAPPVPARALLLVTLSF